MKKLMQFIGAMVLGLLTALSMPLLADDTELYRGQLSNISQSDVPNVVFMLDRSGSMDYYLTGGSGAAKCGIETEPGPNCRRMDHLQYALKQLISEVTNVRIGFMTFIDSGHKKQIPVNYPATNIDSPAASLAVGAATKVVTSSIASGEDDAEQFTEGEKTGQVVLSDKLLQLTGSDGADNVSDDFVGVGRSLGYFSFNDTLENQVLAGHTGIFHNGTPAFEKGIKGNAIKFNGTDQHVTLPSLEAFEFNNKGTISFWYKKTTTGNNQTFLSRQDANGVVDSFRVKINNSNITWNQVQSSNVVVTSKTEHGISNNTVNQWIHVVVAGDDTGVKLYLNGDLVDSSTTSFVAQASAYDWFVGMDTDNERDFIGLIDELGFYDAVWTAETVKKLYDATLAAAEAEATACPTTGTGTGGTGMTDADKALFGNYLGYFDFEDSLENKVIPTHAGVMVDGTEGFVTGKTDFGKALQFDESNERLKLPRHDLFEFAKKEGTISFWYYKTNDDNNVRLLARRYNSSSYSADDRYELYLNGNFVYWRQYDTDSNTKGLQVRYDNIQKTKNTWMHLVLTGDANGKQVYVNGTLLPNYTNENAIAAASQAFSIPERISDWFIGGKVGGGNAFKSSIDQLVFTDKKWTATAVDKAFKGQLPVPTPCAATGGTGGTGSGEPVVINNQIVGLRFQNVEVPQGADVLSANVTLTSASTASGTDTYLITVENAPASAAFQPTPGNLTNRSRTASIEWTPAPTWGIASPVSTPDLSPLIQQVIGTPGATNNGWCGGNAINIFIAPKGDSKPLRSALSYEGAVAQNALDAMPRLSVQYDLKTVPANACVTRSYTFSVTSADNDALQTPMRDGIANDNNVFHVSQNPSSVPFVLATNGVEPNLTRRLIGLRFAELPISSGAKVISAELSLTADENSAAETNPPTLKVSAEAGNAEAFKGGVANVDNLGQRSKTAAISWVPGPWTSGQVYSVDVTQPVKEVIQGTWDRFNNLALFITEEGNYQEGTGYRQAESFESSNGANVPVLKLRVAERYADNTDSVRKTLLEWVPTISTGGATPLVPSLLEMANYYTGGKLYYGDHRANSLSNRVSHPASYAGGAMYLPPPKCTLETLDVWGSGCSGQLLCTADNGNFSVYGKCGALEYDKAATVNYIRPPFSPCQPNYIVFMTDGEANGTDSYATDEIARIVGKSCATRGNLSGNFADDEKCGLDIIEYLYNTDFDTEMPGKQNIITHTVGFLDADAKMLTDWADAGGGKFLPASDAATLLDAFRQILTSIKTESTSFAAPTLSVNAFNKLYHNDELYFALFKPELTRAWAGNVKKYKICDGKEHCCPSGDTKKCLGTLLDKNGMPATDDDGGIKPEAFDLWNISSEADGSVVTKGGNGAAFFTVGPDVGSRKLYTNRSGDVNVNLSLPNNALTESNTTNAMFSVSTNAERTKIINWLQGYKDGDQSAGKRDWMMGDTLHSTPGAITFSAEIEKVYIASNEGAIRQIDAETGNEDWTFIPKDLLPMQQALMENTSSTQHLYGIDGTPAFWINDEDEDGNIETADGDSVRLYVGMRRGGRSIYALDLSDPNAPKFMWQIKGGSTAGFDRLGQTWSIPRPVQILVNGTAKTVLIFGGGYDEATQDNIGIPSKANKGNGIFIVDAENGSLILKIGNEGSGAHMELTGMEYSIPADLAMFSSYGDGLINRIYVGDTGGQVWRIDLNGVSSSGNSRGSSLGGRLAILSNPDTSQHARRFFYRPDIVQANESTLSAHPKYDLILLGSGFRPSPLSTIVTDRLYGLRDRATLGLQADSANSGKLANAKMDIPGDLSDSNPVDEEVYGQLADPKTSGSAKFFTLKHGVNKGGQDGDYDALYDATNNLVQQEINLGEDKAEQQKLRVKHGWFIDLPYQGEKNLSMPTVLNGQVFFTTFVPPGAPLSDVLSSGSGSGSGSGGTSRTYNDPHRDTECQEGKVKFCHSPPGNPENSQSMCLPMTGSGSNSAEAHLENHPFDHMGACGPYDFERPANLASTTCETQEGHGRVYVLNIYSSGAAMNLDNGNDISGDLLEKSDRAKNLGEGIPSQATPIFIEDSDEVVVTIPSGDELHRLNVLLGLPRGQMYWYQE